MLGHLGAMLKLSWDIVGLSGAIVGQCQAILKLHWAILMPYTDQVGYALGQDEPMWIPDWSKNGENGPRYAHLVLGIFLSSIWPKITFAFGRGCDFFGANSNSKQNKFKLKTKQTQTQIQMSDHAHFFSTNKLCQTLDVRPCIFLRHTLFSSSGSTCPTIHFL